MQADVDEASVGGQNAAGAGCEGREVLHVGVGEGRDHEGEGGGQERQPGGVALYEGGGWPRPLPGEAELVG
jgi:hypothetical protein